MRKYEPRLCRVKSSGLSNFPNPLPKIPCVLARELPGESVALRGVESLMKRIEGYSQREFPANLPVTGRDEFAADYVHRHFLRFLDSLRILLSHALVTAWREYLRSIYRAVRADVAALPSLQRMSRPD